jgi:hypothetical protein
MKWLVGILCLLNAGLFLWSSGHTPAAAYPVVNEDNMRLIREMQAGNRSSGQGEPRCARIGPFVDSSVAALAAQKLDSLSLGYNRRTVKSREIRAYRVFLGPFESSSAIEAQRRLLRRAGIEDFYLKRDAASGDIISLGLFTQRNGAETLAAKLGRQDIQARIRPEERTLKPSFWLEIDSPVAVRNLPRELAGARWGEKGAALRRYDCP